MGFWTRVRLPPTPLKAPIRLPGMGDQVGVFKYMINPKVTEDNMNIRKAETKDLSRIAEIYIFNNRINYYPIFKDADFSFGEMQVVSIIDDYFKKDEILKNIFVFDDGLIKGFVQMNGTEIYKLYVDTCFQSEGIGCKLIEFAIKEFGADHLWALEKNTRAVSFYNRHGFRLTGQKKFEEGTIEYLVELKRGSN